MHVRAICFLWFFGSLVSTLDALRCYYCDSLSTKIAPQLWLHSAPCDRRRLTTCPSHHQSCVVVRVSHDRINFTVAGCAQDDYVGCEQFVQLAAHGPTAVHLCQCRGADRCNSDFHLDFGAGLGRFHSISEANKSTTRFETRTNQLPTLKKVHPADEWNKTERTRSKLCADEICGQQTLQNSFAHHSPFTLIIFLISRFLCSQVF